MEDRGYALRYLGVAGVVGVDLVGHILFVAQEAVEHVGDIGGAIGVAEIFELVAKVVAKYAAADSEQEHHCLPALDIFYNRGEVGKGLLLRDALKVVVAAKQE